MSLDSNSSPSSSPQGNPNGYISNSLGLQSAAELSAEDAKGLKTYAASAISSTRPPAPAPHPSGISGAPALARLRTAKGIQPSSGVIGWIIVIAIVLTILGMATGNVWLGFAGSLVALLISLQVIWSAIREAVMELLSPQQRLISISIVGLIVALIGLLQVSGITPRLGAWYLGLNWDAIGATGEVIGAVGQILIALLAVYVAWRQYVIGKDLTIQQNLITQQQTIDSYFQGISELVLDEEGLLEDLPLERAIAAGRTAAILSSVDSNGKAKVLRFLSRSLLLTPLRRDRRLGRAILDGSGSYAEDRVAGTRVIDLGIMLAGADLSGTDLRWADLSDINLIYANLSRCDLVKTKLIRTILCEACLNGADLMGTRFFWGSAETATPRTRADIPDYGTGAFTGAVVEDADFTDVLRMSDEQRYYCCAWGGSATRETIPGGCEGIPNLLGR
ncbi:MAG: pentapeptide repeat-containing protein [Oscillatoriophycideae cyanobacterium NC_groundwater_1537_Pr4_S-0.65um_50_18]|nr:pentapeptide repeat-containing protein [Oscillatoriophycideae cyanobacterium NC_groundwater_1537_Pr4_S-0.65um_50_18]